MSEAARIRELAAATGPRVITSAHKAGAAAGIAMFAAGGNAFDAALAACFMETIALPMKCGLAGDLVALFRVAHGPVQALVSVGPGPAALADGAVLDRLGPCSVGIPGAPGGYAALHRFAKLDLGTLVQPAVRAAETGLAWTRVGLSYVHEAGDLLREYNGATPYMPGGAIPAEGDLLRLPGLGALLCRFARRGAALFQHEDGARLLARLDAMGGILREADLRQDPSRIAGPVSVAVGQARLFGTPAPTGGARLLPMVARAMRGDGALLDLVRQERAAAKAAGRLARDGGTSVVTAADSDGNAAVIVHSNSFPRFGSGIVLDDGLVLNNRPGRGFDLGAPPGSQAAPAAGRIPPTTLHAWAVRSPGKLTMGATPGGVNQLPWNLQAVTELLSGQKAVDLVCNPRWALNERDDLSAEPGAVVSDGVSHAAVAALSHRSAQQVLEIRDSGLIDAVADPRVSACALAAY